MLPLELLKVVFGALSRDDLDALMLANVSFCAIVLRDFAKEPFRYFGGLVVCNHRDYEFVRTAESRYRCGDNDDLNRRMRHGRVGELHFSPVMLFDEDVFDVLLPLKQAWRNGRIRTPRSFASPLLFGRAFRELLFCRSMFVFIDDRFPTSQPFLSRPAVRECTWLNVCHAPSSLSVVEVAEWLNADSRSKEPKRLHVNGNELGDSVSNLIQKLKTDFIESNTARHYVVGIWTEAYEGELGRFVNKSTAEVLIIGRNDSTNIVEVERKLIDHK